MRKRRGRTRMVRRRRSVNRPGGTPETTWEAGWLSCSGLGLPDQPAPSSLDPSRWSVCEVHDPTGEPGAGNPHAGFGERGTGNAAMGAGLRPGAKATDKPPDPNAGAPAPDSTLNRSRPHFGLGRPIIVLSAFRSQVTHEKIKKRYRSAAQKSLHLEGKAVDIRIGGVSTQRLADVARGISQGGIGTYIEKAFVHMDTGKRRSW